MIWRQNGAEQRDEQQQQKLKPQQQQLQQQEHPKRMNFSFNVKIAVNVHTKMSTTHINSNQQQQQQQQQRSKSTVKRHTIDVGASVLAAIRKHFTELGRQLRSFNIVNGNGGISTIVIVNLLMLLLLSLCCDVCRSHDGQAQLQPQLQPQAQHQHQHQPLNYSIQPRVAMLPKLDSDVVEKVAVWHKHAAAAPPSVAEGIAISSGVTYEKPADSFETTQTTDPHPGQPTTGLDERIALESVTRDCVQRCIVEEDLFLDEFGIKCEKADSSEKCYKTRCTKGCAQWYRALKEFEPCQEACSSAQFFGYDMPCIGACEMAQRNYWHLQRLAMGELVQSTQPQLLELPDDQKTGQATPLTIQWGIQFPENYFASRPFNIQYQYVKQEKHDGQDHHNTSRPDAWFNLADYDCDEYFACQILEALMPYTQYRFRFEIPFGESSDEVLYSPATSNYQTPAEGAPISAPIIKDFIALDDSHVVVHWQAGRFSCGPIVSYRVKLEPVQQPQRENSSREQVLPANRQSFIFTGLQQLTNYSVQVIMVNEQGEGPPTTATTVTLARQASKAKEQINSVLLRGEYSIVWKSLEPSGETRIIYHSEQLLSDFALEQTEQRLWVLDVQGQLKSFLLDHAASLKSFQLARNGSQLRATKITLDWLHRRFYMAVEHNPQSYSLLSCDLYGNNIEDFNQLQRLPVEQLELDPLNGWLFWSDVENLWRLDLATKKIRALSQSFYPARFAYNPQHWLLYLFDRGVGQMEELSYDGEHRALTNLLPVALATGDWQSFSHDVASSTLLLANGSQLVRHNYRTNVTDAWPMRDLEWVSALLPIGRSRQPSALRPGQPQMLRALLGAQTAQISWQVPALSPYQSAASGARNWSYELEVLDVASQSVYDIRNIRTQHYGVEKLQADNRYQLRVRAISAAGVAGEWTVPYDTRTWPLGEHRLRWATAAGALYETDELGAHKKTLTTLQLGPEPGVLTTINGSEAYYVNATGALHCINLLHVELNCSADVGDVVQPVGSVAYDWRGGRLYWSDLARDCVVRMDPVNGERELLPIFGARQLALDSAQGHIYYTTVGRLARRTLNGQLARDELEYYHVNGLAGRIAAFTLDLVQRHIYWLVDVRQPTGQAVRLYRAPLAVGAQQALLLHSTLANVDAYPHTLQHVRPLEALLWLAADGTNAWLARTATPEQAMKIVPTAVPTPFTAVQLWDEFPPPTPDPSVVPQAVAPESVRIDDGYWDDFHVRWQPVRTAENHSMHYKVLLEHTGIGGGSGRLQTFELSTPFVRITDMQQAQLSLRIAITPHTAWRAGPTTQVTLATPAAAPTQPKRLRVFVERRAAPLQAANISALIRWDMPEHAHALADGGAVTSHQLAYRVYCWRGEELHAELLHNQSTTEHPLELRVDDLQPDETYTFQVQAFIASTGASTGAATATHAVHIAPEVQSVPRVLYATAEYIGELDLDTRTRKRLVHTASVVEHLALVQGEQRLLWVNENVELMTHVPGTAPAKLARMRAEVLALTVDWVSRIVYWAELNADEPQSAVIYRLELCQFEGRILHGERLWHTPRGRLLRDLIALPHAQALLWLEYDLGARNATLVGRNLSDGGALNFRVQTPLWRMFEGNLEAEAETLNLVDHAGRLCAYDVARQLCTALRAHFNVLSDDIAEVARDAGYLYALRNNSVRAYSRRKQQLEYLVDVAEVRLLRAYNYQAYPPRRCLLLPSVPALEPLLPTAPMFSCEEMQCTVNLPTLHAADDCYLPVPGLRYALNLTEMEDREEDQLQQLVDPAAAGTSLNMTGLQPYTTYELQLRVSCYYQQRLGLMPIHLPSLELQTAPATPSAPRNFSVRVLSPSSIEVSWLPPLRVLSERVWYTLHWQQEQLSSGAELRLEEPPNHKHILTGLQPDSGYDLWLHVHATPTKFNQSVTISVRTYSEVPPLQVLETAAYNLTLSWAGTPDNLSALALECVAPMTQPPEQFSLDVASNYTHILLQSLQPKTRYECQLALSYANTPNASMYRGERLVCDTLGDSPSAPGRPQIEHIAGEIFKVSWTAARDNGAAIVSYNLEALQARRARRRRRREAHMAMLPWAEEPTAIEDQWLDFCNTTELSCIVRELHSRRLLLFRVRARNEPYGWGPYSEDSERVAEPLVSPEKRGSLVLAIIAPAAIVSSCVLALVLVRKVQKRRVRAKKLLEKGRPSIWSNMSTLQTQQQFLEARNRAFSMTSHSTLYTGGPLSDADIALLPQISWNQLTLLRFLGSGAFGEVYEGQLQYEDEPEPQRVAIKSLRKGANEFAELLQEAQLMSNFKHENIVRLIGVCFDSESISLIMEHMEAGDLLSYLRAARPNSEQSQPTLQLGELLAMCIDVATGCSYLEDMHFVHRDLACRNCLVSSADARRRVVKIGDFGLARDIYKSDYYRKEGEGLLPVRWMSPESLVDGVFTTQSDVWAFGVLCWEILTLGQQPYAARNNFEVLAHVKDGGRLQQPEQCPDKLYALLLKCWQTEPEERPSFRRCVNTLHTIATDLRRTQMPGCSGGADGVTISDATPSIRTELKVRFDEAKDEQQQQLPLHNVQAPPPDDEPDFKLYANEGISRL
ncbi:protein sevenless [Scaptodrosophila lebanonensis]|uniref:Tyrosine-protein kinase receptor n=1 Tax=Drosophila lebanonensis TaxID=7225 RepID=A0A6J2TSU9_DROLE|nr:protein sevenless [Scaptodrosophila lebanonensis]XP_030377998.1 protein sevenless [Scaptodrosophila lebanonensis]